MAGFLTRATLLPLGVPKGDAILGLLVGTINVQLFTTLASTLPAGPAGQSAQLAVVEGAIVAEVITELPFPEEPSHRGLVDGTFLHRRERGIRLLRPGEVLAIWPQVAGG